MHGGISLFSFVALGRTRLLLFNLIANWRAWELVPSQVDRGPLKYQAQQGGSMATLWAGTSPASCHQTAPLQQRNFSGEAYLNRYLPWTTSYEGWGGVARAGRWIGKFDDQTSDLQSSAKQENCKYGDQSCDPSKVVIYRDERSGQLQL